jgi:hypothetical protein
MRASIWKRSARRVSLGQRCFARARNGARPQHSGRVARGSAYLLTLWLCACGSDDSETPYDAAPGVMHSDAGLDAALSPVVATGDAQPTGQLPPEDSGNRGREAGALDAAGAPSQDAGTDGDAASADGSTAPEGACTRESLKAAIEAYYAALSAKNPAMLTVSPTLKFTENAKPLKLGEGLWKSAGAVRFKRSALDVRQCETITESVVDNAGQDFIVGLRLKLEAGAISEVESILVGPDGWYPNPKNIIGSSSEDWETPLAEAERWSRDKIEKDIVDAYFLGLFGGKIKVADYPFASTCKRAENGFSPGACNFGVPTSMPMMPLHYVVDLEAGIGVGFVLFGSSSRGMLDFHMFKVKSGKVHGVRAVVGPSVMARSWP